MQKLLKKHFVCTWENLEGQTSAGGSFAHAPSDAAPPCTRGNGKQNVQAIVLTPQGEIVQVISGYIGPEALKDELTTALGHIAALDKAQKPSDRALLLADRLEDRRQDVSRRAFSGPLADWAKRAALRDIDYVAKRPLQPYASFSPTDLTGNGRSFFGSSRGGQPRGRIGETPGLGLDGSTGKELGKQLAAQLRDRLSDQEKLTDDQKRQVSELLGDLLK